MDIEEINNFKENLKYELEQEINLKNNIQMIALKYKKLIQEHRKEKERLAQSNVHSRKIILSLSNRRNTLVSDNNKIYDQFNMVCDLDK